MVYINDCMIIINNKFENREFIYDRKNRVEYNINSDMFDILERIKNNLFTKTAKTPCTIILGAL